MAVCFTAVAATAADAVIKEIFGTAPTGGAKTSRFSYNGSYSTWYYSYARSKTTDKIGSDRAFWTDHKTNSSDNKDCYLETTLEGGLKAVSFKWQQGNAADYPDNLYMSIEINDVEADKVVMASVNASIAANNYSKTFEKKSDHIKFVIYNKSTTIRENPSDIGRILIGPLTITPYLLYTQKDITISVKQQGFVNNNMANNTGGEGTITYESSAESIVKVDAETGVLTPETAGDAIITATWSEGVSTTYTVHVVDEGIVVENFGKVNKLSQVTDVATWHGDLFDWKVLNTRRGYDDTIGLAPRIQATALRKVNGKETYIYSNEPVEGGIKNITFDWRQWASGTSPLIMSAFYTADKENWGDTIAKQSVDAIAASTSHVFNEDIDDGTIGNAYLKLAFRSGEGHAVVGAIKITPWLLYTQKAATIDVRLGETTYQNEALIKHTSGDAVVYSISDNAIGATIDPATGMVTAGTKAGVVTVTAKWKNVTTSYELTILADSATGMEEVGSESVKVRSEKKLIDGQLVIIREGKKYNAQGAIIEH